MSFRAPLAFLFPSQSARYPGMLEEIAARFPPGRDLIAKAEQIVGRDLYVATTEYCDNVDIQLGLFVANYLYQVWLESLGYQAVASVGTSQGELNHLVHIKAIDFWEALPMVQVRGGIYENGPVGARAVLMPVVPEEVKVWLKGTGLELAGLLGPNTVLVGGTLEQLRDFLDELGRLHPMVYARELGVKLPIHCSLFRSVGESVTELIRDFPFTSPSLPYLPNAVGSWVENPTEQDFRRLLAQMSYLPLQWKSSIDCIVERFPGVTLVEVGPSRTQCKLFKFAKGWHPEVPVIHADELISAKERLLSET